MPIQLDDLERISGVENRRALHCRTACDGVGSRGVGIAGSPRSLGNVERDRGGGALELIHERRVASRYLGRYLEGEREKRDGAAINVQLLAAEHDEVSAAEAKSCLAS